MTGSSHVESLGVPHGVATIPLDPHGLLPNDSSSSLLTHQSKKRKHRPRTERVDTDIASTSNNHSEATNDSVASEPRKKKSKKNKVSAEASSSGSGPVNDNSARSTIPVDVSQIQGVELSQRKTKRKAPQDSEVTISAPASQVPAEPASPNDKQRKKKKKKHSTLLADDDNSNASAATQAIPKNTTGISSEAYSDPVNASESSLPKKKKIKRPRNFTGTHNDATSVTEPPTTSPEDPSTDILSQPGVEVGGAETQRKKKRSNKVKRHNAEVSNPDSLPADVPTISAPPAAIPPIASATPAPPSAPPAIQSAPAPSIEQLAQIESTDDLLRAIARTPSHSVLPSADRANATSRASDSSASTSKAKKVRPAKSAPVPRSSAALSLLRAGDGDDTNSILWSQWLSSAELKKVCEAQGTLFIATLTHICREFIILTG